MKHLLIVDNDAITRNTFVGLLKSQGSFLNVRSASGTREALEIVADEAIDMVIAGMHMPEIAIIELMAKLERHHPGVRMIIMTDSASTLLRAKIKLKTDAILFEQALDVSLLLQRIYSELDIIYGGRIHGVSLPSFLQMLELEDSSCTLDITAKGRRGYLYLHGGRPIAANLDDVTGRLAALQILMWQNVTINIDYRHPDIETEITKPLVSLIMESGRLIDEELGSKPDLRKHTRFDCHVAVDYDMSDWTCQCCLMDISLGGAYIRTDQPIESGEKIILSLTSALDRPRDSFNGTVIRRDADGVGVRFEELSLKQKQMIESLHGNQHIAQSA